MKMKKLIILAIICILISACKTTEKKARKWAYDNKSKLAEWCADCFPVKPSELMPGKNIYIPGDTIVTTDTVTVNVDCPDGTQIPCPPSKTRTIRDTLLRVDTLKIRDTAMENVLRSNVDSLQTNVDSLTESRDKYQNFFWWSLAVNIGLVVVFWLFKK